MRYFKSKLSAISREYTKRDRAAIIAAAGNKCTMCDRKHGDEFLFGPTNYLKQQIRFKVYMDIHVIESSMLGRKLVVLCSGCHLSYHLFNRLSESADMGGQRLSNTLYKRCPRCSELNCMCCKKCERLPKWCLCSSRKGMAKDTSKKKKPKQKPQPAEKRLKLRSDKGSGNARGKAKS